MAATLTIKTDDYEVFRRLCSEGLEIEQPMIFAGQKWYLEKTMFRGGPTGDTCELSWTQLVEVKPADVPA